MEGSPLQGKHELVSRWKDGISSQYCKINELLGQEKTRLWNQNAQTQSKYSNLKTRMRHTQGEIRLGWNLILWIVHGGAELYQRVKGVLG